MKLLIILGLLVAVQAGKSPHGEEYLSTLARSGVKPISNNIIEDSLLDVVGLIKKYGYPVETHQIRTEDNYLLSVHRIPYGKNGKKDGDRIPVFLMHGLLMSSADWILNGPGKALGYILADLGFDVWMGNARGNYYSRNHVTLNPDNSKYWRFSWHEIGVYDVPAMIDFVLKKTGKKALHYVGHSQGTTAFFVMCSEKKAYNNKIKSMHAMAPVAYMGHLKSPLIRIMAPMSTVIESLATLTGMNEFLPTTELNKIAANLFCTEGSIFLPVCKNMLFLICGYNPSQLNDTMLPLYMSHTPAGASTRQLAHYGQEHVSHKFRQFDYVLGNMMNYGSLWPPKYKTKSITAPVALHYSDNDWLAEPVDVDQLFKELSNPIGKFRVPLKEFNHLDYMWGIDARKYIYDRIINLILAFD